MTGLAGRSPHLPDRVVAVGVAAGPREEVPVEGPPHVGGDRVPELRGLERDRVVLVDRLAVDHRLRRLAVVVGARRVVAARELGHVAVLPHVEVEPVLVVERHGRAVAARRVERREVGPAVALTQPARHRPQDLLVGLRLHRPVAAEDPDHPVVPVAPPEPLPVDGRVRRGEDLRAPAPLLVPLVAPRGQEADVEAERVGLLDHEVDVVPVVVRGALLHVRPRGIVVEEGQVPVGVRVREPVELGERHRLDDGEALSGAVLEVAVRLLAVQPVEELPGTVSPR